MRGMKTTILTAAMLLVSCAAFSRAAEPQRFYRLESALTIPSATAPNWDYLAFDSERHQLYIARRDDGILIYDTVAKQLKGVIADSVGGNATTLVPDLDRGIVTNEDGSLTIFQLSTQKTLSRQSVGKSADNSFYDFVTQQLLVTMGDEGLVSFVDARSGKLNGTLHLDSESIEGSVADGEGNFFVALRDRDKVVKINARTRTLVAEFKPENCSMPNSLAFDLANHRLLVGCRGEHPILAVLDVGGKTLSGTPIGRGNDSIVFDPATRRVYTANGLDATLVILDQVDADSYQLSEAPTTRPYARTMALDPQSLKVYLVCAEGTVDPGRKRKTKVASFYPNRYFMNTFTLLTYSRQ